MVNYVQADIDNSTTRRILNFAIPYDMASIYLGVNTVKTLNICTIQLNNKPYLINKKK